MSRRAYRGAIDSEATAEKSDVYSNSEVLPTPAREGRKEEKTEHRQTKRMPKTAV
jgi:hypothetical protein